MFQKFRVKGFKVFNSFLDIITDKEDSADFRLGFSDLFVKERKTFQTVLELVVKDVFQRFDVFLIDRIRFLVESRKVKNTINDVLVNEWYVFTLHSELIFVPGFEFPEFID
jgi:hypothetical protein